MSASLLKGVPCREVIMPLCVMVAFSTPGVWLVSLGHVRPLLVLVHLLVQIGGWKCVPALHGAEARRLGLVVLIVGWKCVCIAWWTCQGLHIFLLNLLSFLVLHRYHKVISILLDN